ncbi:MAG: nitroreductase family protein [Eubacteriales bacterium]|jgi:nitroreductase
MTAYELCKARRTVRRFTQTPVTRELLLKYVDAARVAPSGANLQPLKYHLVTSPEECAQLFPMLAWAGYLKPAGTPEEGARPTAYIVMLHDTEARETGVEYDCGAAMMSILLCAQEDGVGTCWLGSVDRERVGKLLNLPETLRVLHIIALGYPAQEAREVPMDGSVRYWIDEDQMLNVPKRSMEEILY